MKIEAEKLKNPFFQIVGCLLIALSAFGADQSMKEGSTVHAVAFIVFGLVILVCVGWSLGQDAKRKLDNEETAIWILVPFAAWGLLALTLLISGKLERSLWALVAVAPICMVPSAVVIWKSFKKTQA